MDPAEALTAFPELTDIELLGDPAGQKLVFSARLSGVPLALKLVRISGGSALVSAEDAATVQLRLNREIDILARANSDFIPRLGSLEPGIRDINGESFAYYSEELIEGEPVSELVRTNGRLSVHEVAQMGADVAHGLETMRRLDKVHRDVKPSNIMRRSAIGRYVLIDPGYAFDLAGPSLTVLAGIPGTPAYMSPEQTNLGSKRSLDFRSDLYSLGVVMFEAMAGQHPYRRPGMSQADVIDAARTQPVLPILGVGAGSERLWPIVLRLLRKRPHLRYNSPLVLVEAIAEQFAIEGAE